MRELLEEIYLKTYQRGVKTMKKVQLGQKLNADGWITVTKKGRLVMVSPGEHTSVLVLCSIDELAKVVRDARKFKGKGLFYKHLSPDVSFGFVKPNHQWLTGRKRRNRK